MIPISYFSVGAVLVSIKFRSLMFRRISPYYPVVSPGRPPFFPLRILDFLAPVLLKGLTSFTVFSHLSVLVNSKFV